MKRRHWQTLDNAKYRMSDNAPAAALTIIVGASCLVVLTIIALFT